MNLQKKFMCTIHTNVLLADIKITDKKRVTNANFMDSFYFHTTYMIGPYINHSVTGIKIKRDFTV